MGQSRVFDLLAEHRGDRPEDLPVLLTQSCQRLVRLEHQLQLVLGGAAIALVRLTDEVEMFKRSAGQLNILDRNVDAVNRRSVQ